MRAVTKSTRLEYSASSAARVLKKRPQTILRWVDRGIIPDKFVRIRKGVQRRIYLQRQYVLELRSALLGKSVM